MQKEGPLSENKLANDSLSPMARKKSIAQKPNPFAWLVNPSITFKLVAFPVVLWANWEYLTPYYFVHDSPNPFASLMFLSHPVPTTSPSEPILYQKGYLDIAFVLYHVIVFSFIRVMVAKLSKPITRHFGVRKSKHERFGAMLYEMLYFAVMGAWGLQVMYNLPTWWYNTKHYWTGYPEWRLDPSMKRYYLTQLAFWTQQFTTMVLGLDKLRTEMMLHHFITMCLILSSYLLSITFIGNAVFVSMDLPDILHSMSKLLNYMRFERAKVVSLVFFIAAWTYFRHYLNIMILWSILTEFKLIPEAHKVWMPENGSFMPWYVQPALFIELGALQLLNLFWYFCMMRILVRTLMTFETTDDYSDDEDNATRENKSL